MSNDPSRYDYWNHAIFRIQSGSSKNISEDEKSIAENAFASYCYSLHIKERFLLGEEIIAENEVYSFLYYRYILKPRNIKLRKNSRILTNYKKQLSYEIVENILLI